MRRKIRDLFVIANLGLLVSSAVLATHTPALAQTSSPAIRVLLEKAKFWYEHGQTDVALTTFDRVLDVEPGNIDALIGAAKVAIDTGREDLVKSYASRLRRVAPQDPFLASIDTAKRHSSVDAAILQDARHLAVLGRRTEALARYRSLMSGGKVPDELAAEYYPLLLSSLPQDSVESDTTLTALRKVADAHSNDLNLQMGLAQGLIINEGSRADGIELLRTLSHNPVLANRVRVMWRQALLWQGADVKALDQIEDYLKENPSDPEIQAKLAEFRATLPSKALRARMLGYEAITEGDLKAAEANFREAIDGDKTDADAWIMMAVVRLKQGLPADAKPFVAQAVALAPARKAEFLGMVGADPVANAKYAADAARVVAAQYKEIAALTDAGKYDTAAAQLRRLIGGRRDAGLTLQLADIESRGGHHDAALASLRDAVEMDPSNADATLALASALTNDGQNAEAQALFSRAEDSFRRSGNDKALRDVHRAQADQIRRDALRLSNLGARETALRAALAADPSSWWTRLEIARVMQMTGRTGEANAVIAQAEQTAVSPGALDTPAGQEALQVAVVWAQERADQNHALALARMAPPNSRSPAMQSLLQQGAFRDQVDAIAHQPDYAARLVALAGHPDLDGMRGDLIGHALLRQKDIPAMRSALAAGLVATPRPSSAQRLRYGALLMEANQIGGARSVLEVIDRPSLSTDQRRMLDAMRDRMAVAQADELVRNNRAQDAQVMLAPLVMRYPDNVTLQVAMARVDVASGRSTGALNTLLAAVERDPNDRSARFGAIEAASAAGRLSLADDLAQDGVKLYPNDPFMLMQAANAARARGLNGRALQDLERARAIRAANLAPSATSEAND